MPGAEVAWALALVLALIGALRVAARFTGFDPATKRGRSLRVVETCALGPKRSVMLLEASGERLLIASSETGIELLRVLEEEEATTEERPAPRADTDTEARQSWQRRFAGIGARLGAVLPFALTLFATLAVGAGEALAEAQVSSDALVLSLEGAEGAKGLSSSIELLVLMTLISVAPSLLLMTTCFTRIVIVLAFVRQALGVQSLPPNQVLVGLALFLTLFVMAPLGEAIKTEAYEPYSAGQIEAAEAVDRGMAPVRRYLMSYAKENDVALFAELAADQDSADAAHPDGGPDLQVLLPAFLLSELRTAFEIGFTIFLPFLVIDLVVASMLISMGMIVLPPIVVSLPFKLMLFVLVDGWNLVLGALVNGLR